MLVKNLSVFFDSALKFDKQLSSVVKTIFYHLRVLAKVKSLLSYKDFERVIHAFILRRVDYFLYVDINHASLVHLVQNAATRLLTGVPKYEHFTTVLISLDWLPFHHRINFKVLVLVFKTWNGQASACRARSHENAYKLHSKYKLKLVV